MPLELLDDSEVKPIRETPRKIEKLCQMEILRKKELRFCERTKSCMSSNCVLCQSLNKEFFDRCNNKWNYNE